MQSNKLLSGGLVHSDYINHAKKNFVDENEFNAFFNACGLPLRKSLRINTLKTNQQEFLKIAQKYHWKLTSIPWCEDGFWVELSEDNVISLGNTPEHIQGLFYIQEASSMLPPAALLDNLSNEMPLVLDMAAAPGSKTTQIAAMLNNQGIVLANELSASRLKFLSANLVRCGIVNTAMSHLDARKIGGWMPAQFDYVLLDAPCGGEGTVRKDINALKDWSLAKVNEIAGLQKSLILSAYQSLKPGGRMVYSTCTLSPEENQQVADYLVDNTDAIVEPLNQLFVGAEHVSTDKGYLLVLPHKFDSEGFFIARFTKPKTDSVEPLLKPIYSMPFIATRQKEQQLILNYYSQHFAMNIKLDNYELLQREKEIWLFPKQLSGVNQYIKVNRAGIKIAQIYPNKIRTTHEFVCCFGQLANQQRVELNLSQFADFYKGLNIELNQDQISTCDKGEVILCYQNQVVGLGQNQKGRIKNGLPRDLVKDNFKLT